VGGAVVILFFLPWLDRCAVKSIRFRPDWHVYLYAIFVVDFFVLGYLGTVPSNVWGQFSNSIPVIGGVDKATVVARIFTITYFLFFALMPYYSKKDKTKPVPTRVSY